MNGWRVAKRIAHETLDGEVVILDQGAGTYFSLSGSGPEVWALLERGGDLDGVAAALGARFTAADGQIASDVAALIAKLEAETLIEAVEVAAGVAASVAGGGGAWVTPTFERFDDLQSLLVLDPIHDVDERGWPRKETGGDNAGPAGGSSEPS